MIPGSGRSLGEGIGDPLQYSWAFLVAQTVKNPPAVRETWVQSLGWEDPLEQAKGSLSPYLNGVGGRRWASLIAQLVKNTPAMQETLVRFLGQEDPLEKG